MYVCMHVCMYCESKTPIIAPTSYSMYTTSSSIFLSAAGIWLKANKSRHHAGKRGRNNHPARQLSGRAYPDTEA